MTDAELDVLNVRHLKDIGFTQRGDGWYFAGQLVDMGTPLAVPDSMRPMLPADGKRIAVVIEATAIISELKQIQINGKTNLPEETSLMIDISCTEQNYSAGCEVTVRNGQFEGGWFRDSKRPLNRLGDGRYRVKIFTPIVSVQKPSVEEVLGERGMNMSGELVKFDEVLGNRAKFEMTVNLQ